MALEYTLSIDEIMQRLETAHSQKAVIRGEFLNAEYLFFREHIKNQHVLVAGSGLGHDSFELAGYNKSVVGIELIPSLVEYSNKRKQELGLDNLVFQNGDFTNLNMFNDRHFDSAVLNMGTIGNFDYKTQILSEMTRVADTSYFDFYTQTLNGLKKRREMYIEEGWINVRIHGNRIMSDDGMDSTSLSGKEITSILAPLGVRVRYHQFHEFAVMAEVTR